MQKDEKRKTNPTDESDASRGRSPESSEAYEPPRLLKFDKLEKLIVSGE